MKSWSRRKFLGGAGAMVGLPMLESLQPKIARAASSTASPRRLVVFYFPCGRNPDTWIPKATGNAFTLPTSLQSLGSLKGDMLMMSGLTDAPSLKSRGIGDHAMGTGTLLTGMPILNGNVFQAGVSVDQVIANSIGRSTRFSSLQWTSAQPTVCDLGCSCIYTQCISWADASTPLAPISDPLTAYNQLFAGSDPGATAAQQAARSSSLKSVLDYVLEDAKSFVQKLSTIDQDRMKNYFDSVRDLETNLFAKASVNCDPGTAPSASVSYQTSVKAFCDMMVMALQCDLTRVITYMIEFDISYRSHPWVNSNLGHHALTHTAGDDALQQLIALETWEATQLSYFATKLKAATDANGVSLLDNSVILATPAMGLGGVHDHNNLAPMFIGKCGGAFNTGAHKNYGNQQPYCNMLVSLQNAFGINAKTFGLDGTQNLPGIS